MDRRAALWACLAAGFATLFDATTVAYTAPSLASTFGAPTSAVQWFLASFSLTFGLGLVPGGRLGDAFGRRRLFLLGLTVFLVGGVLSATGPEVGTVIAGRFVQGLGAGVISAQVLGVLQDLYRGPARLRAFAAYSIAGAAAGLVGPLVAGLLLTTVDDGIAWRIVLAAPLPFVVGAAVLARRALPRVIGRTARVTIDLPAIALLGAVVVLVMLPVIEPGLARRVPAAVLATVVVLVVALVVWERDYTRRGRLALFTPTLVRSRGFVAGNVVALLWFGALLAQSSVLTLYLLQATGASALTVAAIFVPGAVGRMFASSASGRLFARLGVVAVVIGLAVEVVLGVVLALVAPELGLAPLLLLVAVANAGLGAAGGLVEPTLRALTLAHAPPELHGVAASFLQLTQRLSATYAIALTTGILLGTRGLATAQTLRQALLMCAAAVAVALVVALDVSLRRAAETLRRVP